MSTNSQSENGESVSILGSDELDEVNQQQHKEGSQQLEEVDMEQDPERLSLKSVSSSVSSGMVGSQHTTDTEADEPLEGDEDQPLLDESDDEPIEVLETGEEAVDTAAQARAISRLILFSLVLISVPLTAMYTSYRFIFTDHYHLPRDKAILYAGLIAGVLVYIIVGIFAWIAYRDERTVAAAKQQIADKSKKIE